MKFDSLMVSRSSLPGICAIVSCQNSHAPCRREFPFHQIGFRLVRPCCKVRRPERLDRLFPLRREWSEVAALEVAKAERKTLQREVVLLAKMRSELARSRRTGQRAGRDKAVGDYLIFGGPENRKSIQLMAWIPNLRAVSSSPGAVITSGVNAG
jgi:hypothetical protein